MTNVRKLREDELWNRCDPALFDFETTASLPGEVAIIGQERAVESIAFGIEIDAVGFFARPALPPLDLDRTTPGQVELAFAHRDDPARPADFD